MQEVWLGHIHGWDWERLIGVFKNDEVAKATVEQERDPGRHWGPWHRTEAGDWIATQNNEHNNPYRCVVCCVCVEDEEALKRRIEAKEQAVRDQWAAQIAKTEALLAEQKCQLNERAKEKGKLCKP